MPEERLLLAIDGGQTATKALLARADGTVLGRGLGGPSDHFHIEGGVEKNRRAIVGALDDVLAATGRNPEHVVAAGLGLTGAGSGIPEVVIGMVRERLAPREIIVVPDYVTNLAGASGGEPGVVLIAGGGSIGYGVTAQGDEAIAGGYGFLLGDEGSAFNIGLRAIAAACRGADFRDQLTALTGVVAEHFEVERARQLPGSSMPRAFPVSGSRCLPRRWCKLRKPAMPPPLKLSETLEKSLRSRHWGSSASSSPPARRSVSIRPEVCSRPVRCYSIRLALCYRSTGPKQRRASRAFRRRLDR